MCARILIADDDASVRRLLELMLRKGHYQLAMAPNGFKALEYMQNERPDIVICDLMMPEMDGFEVLRAAKADAKLAHIPIIVVTAAGQQAHVEEALRLGAAACVLKPFAQAHFLETVRAALAPLAAIANPLA
jgi:chemosensory pili system protein ChpA (sensor histidine kinase/response regulator)